MKRLSLDEARDIAQRRLFEAMLRFPRVPDVVKLQLVLGYGPDGDYYHFELYVPADVPENALVLVEARVHQLTGETSVTTYPDRWTSGG